MKFELKVGSWFENDLGVGVTRDKTQDWKHSHSIMPLDIPSFVSWEKKLSIDVWLVTVRSKEKAWEVAECRQMFGGPFLDDTSLYFWNQWKTFDERTEDHIREL